MAAKAARPAMEPTLTLSADDAFEEVAAAPPDEVAEEPAEPTAIMCQFRSGFKRVNFENLPAVAELATVLRVPDDDATEPVADEPEETAPDADPDAEATDPEPVAVALPDATAVNIISIRLSMILWKCWRGRRSS